jgi:D-3-phosphoglycerate dehydrogenase
VDEEFANSRKILCLNAGEANSDAVGEHTIGMLLGLLHKIGKGDAEVRKSIWDREGNRGLELKGKTIGIIGYGNTGSAVAKKLRGFEVQILAYDKFKSGFGNEYVEETDLQNIFERADILTIHIPLDSHTKLMINSEFIHSFVRNIFLLTLSRGGIVKTKDVLDAMKKGKILGFSADVLEHENPRGMGDADRKWFDELIHRNDVLLTPHVAGWTVESYEKISAVLAQKICAEWPRL